jgi:hypothetical protein
MKICLYYKPVLVALKKNVFCHLAIVLQSRLEPRGAHHTKLSRP